MHRLKSRLGLQIISFSTLLDPKADQSAFLLLFQCAALIRSHADELHFYKEMLSYPAFFQELLSFGKECAEWGITADDLPARDGSEEELKKLLGWILAMDLPEKKQYANADARLKEIAAMENIRILPGFESSCARYRLLQKLQEKGVPVIKEDPVQPRGYLRHALSLRQEAEAVAQDICRRQKPCLVILCSPKTQTPLVRQVFSRYGIPVSFVSESSFTRVQNAFFQAVSFMLEKDASHLLDVFASGLLAPCEGKLLAYLRQAMTGTEAPSVAVRYAEILSQIHSREDDTVMKNKELVSFQILDKQAAAYFAAIDEPLQKMLKAEEPQEILTTAYEILAVSPLLANEDDTNAGMQIRKMLTEVLPYIRNREDVMFTARCVLSVSVSVSSSLSPFCMVTDLHHPLNRRSVSYVLGCCGRDYPGFKARNGLFDEDYVKEISAFPALSIREKVYRDQLAWVHGSAEEEIYYSYATNDYEGRQMMPSFDLGALHLSKDERWPLLSVSQNRFTHHRLSTETAQALFTKTDQKGSYIRGSVSSIEAWFGCPYRYFIASGLYARKEQIPSVDAAHIGTIQHAVMENALNEAGENYAEWLTEEHIDELIAPYFDALEIIEPHHKNLIRISRKRMLKSLCRSVAFLKEYEACTTFRPACAEMHFDQMNISEHVRLNGTIDRINLDRANSLLEIMDYKSSAKNLTVAKVKEGFQLQLLSYLMTALRLYEYYKAGGAYYVRMKEEKVSNEKELLAAYVERRKFTITENDFQEGSEKIRSLVRDSRRLQGWALTDRTDAIDRDGDHVASLKTVYDPAAVEECLQVLYEYFWQNLLRSEESQDMPVGISLAPIEGACTFCDYAAVCRFHGDTRDPAKIYEKDLKPAKEVKA